VKTHTWQECFRAWAPHAPLPGLVALAEALRSDDPALVQEHTAVPRPSWAAEDAASIPPPGDIPCKGACAIGYVGWRGEALGSILDVEDWFNEACKLIDSTTRESCACRHLIRFWDDTERNQARRQLLPVVEEAIRARSQPAAPARDTG
jgi:hypothetical protein